MKIIRLLVAILLFASAPAQLLAASISVPQKVSAYLNDENNYLTEDGLLPFSNPGTGDLANYVYNNWRAILTNFNEVAPEPREQCLIVASAELLSPDNYVQFVSGLCDLRTEGRAAPQAIWAALWAGMNKNDFLAYNYDRPEVAALINKLQTIMLKENPKQWTEFFKEIKSGELKQNVIQRRKQDGDSMPEVFTGPIRQDEKAAGGGTPRSTASSDENTPTPVPQQAPPFQSPGAHPFKEILPWSLGILVSLVIGIGLYFRFKR